MASHQQFLELRTDGRSLSNVTQQVADVVVRSGVRFGTCTVFLMHTSASLVIQENADPAVLRDLEAWLAELAPESRNWEHDDEGPDDMPAHARAALTRTSETLIVSDGRLLLGTWQGLYVWEHRRRPHTRRLAVMVVGD